MKENKKTEKSEKAGGRAMGGGLFSMALSVLKEFLGVTKQVIDASDPEKLANGVDALNKNVNQTFDQMRQIIVNSNKFSDEEKIQRLQELAEQEKAANARCEEAIKGNRENVAKITMDVVKGLLTCGMTFVPEIVKKLRIAASDEVDALEVVEEASPLLEETSRDESPSTEE